MASRSRSARNQLGLLVWLSFISLLISSGCGPQRTLGEGPPKIGEDTAQLPAFDPAALAGGVRAGDPTRGEARSGPPAPPEPPPLPPAEIYEVYPADETSTYADISVRFNRPMVPLGNQEQMSAEQAGLRIDPPLAGQAQWVEPTRLVFHPDDELPLATDYSVHFEAELAPVDGEPKRFTRDWSFHTAGPRVDLWVDHASQVQGSSGHHWRARVLASVDQAVKLGNFRKQVRAESVDEQGQRRPVEIKVRELPRDRDGWREADFEIRPATHWPANSNIDIYVGAELVGKLGPRPMGYEEMLTFPSSGHVHVTEWECVAGSYQDGCELGPIALHLSTPIKRSQGRSIRIEPAVRGGGARAMYRQHEWREQGPPRALDAYEAIEVWGDFKVGETYAITLDALVDIHGQTLAEPETQTFSFVEPPPRMQVTPQRGSFSAATAAEIGVESRHLDSLRVRVLPLEGDQALEVLRDQLARERDNTERESVSALERVLAKASESSVPLNHQGSYAWSSLTLDLRQRSGRDRGLVAFELAPGPLLPRAKGRRAPVPQRGLIQLSELSLSALETTPRTVLRVAKSSTDAPAAGASVELLDGANAVLHSGQTDGAGLLELPAELDIDAEHLLRVTHGQDTLLMGAEQLAREPAVANDLGLRPGERVRAALTSERSLYKPGERVRAMGWASIASPYTLASLRPLPEGARATIELHDFDGELVDSAEVMIKAHGKFWATLDIPSTASLGGYELTAKLLGTSVDTSLRVKDYRVPEFEVSAEAERSDLHHGESTAVSLRANYYFGGAVPMLRTRETTSCFPANYRPPGLDPGWSYGPRRTGYYYASSGFSGMAKGLAPSAEGAVDYQLTPRASDTALPARCTHSVAVADASQQEVGAEATLWLHPNFYVAAKHSRYLEAGEDLEVELRTLDFDGSALPAESIVVELTRSWSEPEYEQVDGQREFIGYASRTKKLAPCETKAGDEGLASCRFTKLAHGSYSVHVVAQREGIADYAPSIEGYLWVREPDVRPTMPRGAVERLTVDLSDADAEVGDRVRVQVRAPWQQGEVVLAMIKGGIHTVHPLTLDQGRASVELEVLESWAPGLGFTALAIQPGDASARVLPRPRTASARLEVGIGSRTLSVEIEAPETAQPREQLPIEVRARDSLDRPARGHVSVWAVDEAIFALSPLELPDFVQVFNAGFGNDPSLVSSYRELLLPYLTRPDPYSPIQFEPGWREGLGLSGTGRGGGGYGSGSGAGFGGRGKRSPAGAGMPQARSKFESAPIFIGDAELDEDGVARLEGELPDNLTTFRLSAVVSSPLTQGGDPRVEPRFGVADARTRVTKPLVARAALPRVMRPGDSAELGVLLDNLRAGTGQLSLEVALVDEAGEPVSDGPLELLGSAKASVALASGAQVRLPFQVRARTTGLAYFEVRARLEPDAAGNRPSADVLRLPIPVEAERTLSDRVAVYGELGAKPGKKAGEPSGEALAAALPFVLPTQIDPNFGGLSVSVASSILGGVEDAVAYLVDYPYGCVEQTSSSLLPLIPLGELARQGYPMGIEDTEVYVAAGVQRLRSMQLYNGAFSYWPGGSEPAPYASAYATWVLVRAQASGYRVPLTLLNPALDFLRARVSGWAAKTAPSADDDVEAAMALWTLATAEAARSGSDADRKQLREGIDALYERRARLPVFARAVLTLAMAQNTALLELEEPRLDELLTSLAARVDERQGFAKIESDSRWTWYWDSNVRSSALVLLAYLAHRPEHPLVPKLTRGLLESRRGGRWSNTQENAFALLALARYAAVYEAEEPDFEARVWLANEPLVAIEMLGRGFGIEDGFTPMAELLAAIHAQGEGDPGEGVQGERAPVDRLILERAGTGRMYYRVGLEWASTRTDLPAKAEGVAIRRELRDAERVLGEDPSVASGSLLAMDVELELHAPLDYLAAELPLPAGLEAVDVELGKGKAAMRISGSRGGWVSHQELRRDRALVFADHLAPGTYRTTIFLRATTPGDYTMPAATAELMYYPEIYARTTGQRVQVR